MKLSTPRARPRTGPGALVAALLSFVLAGAVTPTAAAQGRCSCNSGCHMFPGQCVQPGSAGCEAGFAPFCGTRATSCPNLGWVSCSGECTCVRIAPLDAGVPDAGRADVLMSTDAPVPVDRTTPADTSVATDVPRATDVGTGSDVLASMDARTMTDVPASRDARAASDAPAASDVLASMDRPALADGAASSDVPARDAVAVDGGAPPPDAAAMGIDTSGAPADRPVGTPDAGNAEVDGGVPGPDAATASDATTAADGGCDCAGGACVAGVCYRERCTFNAELGFVCTTPGTACRLFGADPICVPVCAGVTCARGEFCDDRSNGACVVDRCATIPCPAGTTCLQNQCGRWSGADGGVFVAKDADLETDAAASAPTTATDGGCGCRAGDRSPGGRAWPVGAVLVALAGLLRSRRRRGVVRSSGR